MLLSKVVSHVLLTLRQKFFLMFEYFHSWPSTFPSILLPHWEFDFCLCWACEPSFSVLFTFKQIPLCMSIKLGEMRPSYPLRRL